MTPKPPRNSISGGRIETMLRDLHVGAIQPLRGAFEALVLPLLGAERLHDPVAGERFGGDVRQVLERLLAAPRACAARRCPSRTSGYTTSGAPVTQTSASRKST